MAGLSFLAKKSWHTSNISNQEKVWLAEQKAQAEAQKLKELQTQIQLEREKEEFEKLAGKKSKGDRGVNWMYEEGGGPAYEGENAELQAAKEEEEKEAYLLGKEYVPKGQEKHVGDFAVAATMGGVLEKASTRGATIGVAEARGGEPEVRLKDDNEEQMKDDGRSEFNREFHLRHEDPMFSVHQKREMQRKDAEKKRLLMEKAGLVVKEVRKGDAHEGDSHRDHARDGDKKARNDRSRKHTKHKHRRRRERSSSPSSRSSSNSRDRRHRKKHRHHSRRRERRRERSSSRDRSLDRHSDDSRRRYSRREDTHKGEDRRPRHHHERKRERSRSKDRSERRDRYDKEESHRFHHSGRPHDDDDTSLDEFGRKKHHSRDMVCDGNKDSARQRKHNYMEKDERNYDLMRSDRTNEHTKRSSNREDTKQDPPAKKEGYGLIGTSLSGDVPETSSSNNDGKPVSLGPDASALAAKRREVEKERQSKLELSRRRRDCDGRSREDKERVIQEFERNARDRK